MINVLILGANGLIGSHLIKSLESKGIFKIYAFSRINKPIINPLYIQLDYSADSISQLRKLVNTEWQTCVVNATYDSTNINNNQRIIDFIFKLTKTVKVDKILHLSSIAIFDGYQTLAFSNKSINPYPISLYGKVKRLSEDYLVQALKDVDVAINIIRLPNILGPNSSWDNYFVNTSTKRVLHVANKGNNTSVFLQINQLCECLQEEIQSDGAIKVYVRNIYECASFRKWNEVFIEYGFKGTFGDVSSYTFHEKWLVNLILYILSNSFIVRCLFFSKVFNHLIYSKLISKDHTKPDGEDTYYSQNTARIIQKVNCIL
jgi:nucleoside-diphosphate-sugar epimerase